MNKDKTRLIKFRAGHAIPLKAAFLIMALIAAVTLGSDRSYSFSPGKIDSGIHGMSIKKILSYALIHNKLIKIDSINLDIASYEKKEAFSGFLPKINFNEIYMNTDNPLYAFGNVLNQRILTNRNVQGYFSPAFLNNPGMIHNFESEFEIQQPIFMGGKIYLSYEKAKLHRKALSKKLSETKQKTLFEVAKAYYSAVLAKKYVILMKSMVKTAGSYKKLAQNLYKAGQVVSSDVLRAKVNLASMKEKLADAKKNYRLAIYYLNIMAGIPISSEYRLTSALRKHPYKKQISVAGLQEEAFNNRPDLKEIKINKKIMKAGVKEAYGNFLPSLVAGYDYYSNGPAIHPDDSYSYALTVMLHFNIFSGLYDYNNLQVSKSKYNTLMEYESLLRDKIEMQVRKAYLQYKTDLINTGVAELAVKNAKDTLRITTNRYKAGITTLLDLDETLDQFKAARVNYIMSLYKLNVDKYYIELVTGKLHG